jgi:hypothetical protein
MEKLPTVSSFCIKEIYRYELDFIVISVSNKKTRSHKAKLITTYHTSSEPSATDNRSIYYNLDIVSSLGFGSNISNSSIIIYKKQLAIKPGGLLINRHYSTYK